MTEDLMSRFGLTREQVLSTYGNGEKLDVELAHNALGLDDAANKLLTEVQTKAKNFSLVAGDAGQAFLDVFNGIEGADLSKLEGFGEKMPKVLSALGYTEGTEAYDTAYTQFLTNFVDAVKATAQNEARARTVLGDKFDSLSSETQKQFGSMLSNSSKYFGRKGANEFKGFFL